MSMRIIKKMCKQDAVLWAVTVGPDGSIIPDGYGQPTYGQPKQIKCYWKDEVGLYISAAGENRQSQSIVFVLQDIGVGSILFKGTLAAVPLNLRNKPKSVLKAFKVQRFDVIPTLDGKQFVRKAFL